jgi:imidazoleglycerol phosphate dehydratase HisB
MDLLLMFDGKYSPGGGNVKRFGAEMGPVDNRRTSVTMDSGRPRHRLTWDGEDVIVDFAKTLAHFRRRRRE